MTFAALFLPTQSIGFSPKHTRFAGTLTLMADTLICLWTDLAEPVVMGATITVRR